MVVMSVLLFCISCFVFDRTFDEDVELDAGSSFMSVQCIVVCRIDHLN